MQNNSNVSFILHVFIISYHIKSINIWHVVYTSIHQLLYIKTGDVLERSLISLLGFVAREWRSCLPGSTCDVTSKVWIGCL